MALWSLWPLFHPTAQPHYTHVPLGPCKLLGLLVDYTILTSSAKTIHFCIFYTSLVTLLLPTQICMYIISLLILKFLHCCVKVV